MYFTVLYHFYIDWYLQGHFDNSGYTVGRVDEEGKLTGDNIAYIYPDWRSGLVGRFEDGVLVSARLCPLVGCYEESGLKIPAFGDPTGPEFTFEKTSIRNIALHPLLRDPWEEERVRVGQSRLPQVGPTLESMLFEKLIRVYTPSLLHEEAFSR